MLQQLQIHWVGLLSSRAIPSKPQNPKFLEQAALNASTTTNTLGGLAQLQGNPQQTSESPTTINRLGVKAQLLGNPQPPSECQDFHKGSIQSRNTYKYIGGAGSDPGQFPATLRIPNVLKRAALNASTSRHAPAGEGQQAGASRQGQANMVQHAAARGQEAGASRQMTAGTGQQAGTGRQRLAGYEPAGMSREEPTLTGCGSTKP